MRERPVGWTVTTLEQLGLRIEAGLNVRCEERPPTSGERGLVKISAVTWGRFDEEQSKTLPAHAQVNERHRIEAGDLLMSRANTIELVGSAVLVGEVQKRLYLSDKVLRLNIPAECRRWVHYALKSPESRRAIANASSGNQLSMRNISQDKIRSLAIPVAPLKEQQRIADKLDTVLAGVDACRDRLARVAPLLKRLRQSVLAAAYSGRLTEDWPEAFPESRQSFAALGTVSGGLTKNARREALSLRRPYLRVANVYANELLLSDVAEIGLTPSEFEKTRLQPGDLLIVEGNGSIDQIGRVAIWADEVADCCHQNHLIRWRAGPSVMPKFGLYYLLSPEGRGQIERVASSTTGLHTLSVSKVGALLMPLPTIDHQREIVRRVETLFSYADRLEARLAAAQSAVDRLTPALLAKAFRGELVPQDPADEPASELLRRLAQSRSTPAPKPRKRQTA